MLQLYFNEFGPPRMFKQFTHIRHKSFAFCEAGGVTVETVIWIPFVFLLSIAVADTFLVYMTHASAQLTLEDTTRLMIVGAIQDCASLETRINTAIQATIPSAVSKCSLVAGQATVSLLLPAKEMGIGAIAGFIDSFELVASNSRSLEYFEGT